ncbi:MAG: ECF-type sigma factor [Pirellulaceae bacterium]
MSDDPDASVTRFFQELRQGNQASTQQVWEYFAPRMLKLARTTLARLPVRVLDAEDVAQSAFISFWRRTQQDAFVDPLNRDNLWSLLTVITVRKAGKVARDERARKRGGGQVKNEAQLGAAAEADFRIDEALAALPSQDFDLTCEELLGRLDQEPRSIALLKLLSHTNREIAEMLSCTERKVERKLQLIRRIWGQELDA